MAIFTNEAFPLFQCWPRETSGRRCDASARIPSLFSRQWTGFHAGNAAGLVFPRAQQAHIVLGQAATLILMLPVVAVAIVTVPSTLIVVFFESAQ